MHHVTRGYFGLQDNDYATEPIPRCWFYGPNDGLVLDVPPAQTGMDLGGMRRACGRDHRRHQRVQRSRDDLSHGCHIRSEQCHHDARVGPFASTVM